MKRNRACNKSQFLGKRPDGYVADYAALVQKGTPITAQEFISKRVPSRFREQVRAQLLITFGEEMFPES